MANIPNSPIVLFGQIDGAPVVSQTYNNPTSSHHGVAYYFSINIDIDNQSTMAGDGSFITASSVVAGMWIAEQTGKSWLITNVETVDANTLTLTIKDVNLHNYFSDVDFNNIYLGYYPSGQDKYMIFSLSEDAVPIIPILVNQYLAALGLRSEWITDVMTRFQYRNLLKSHYNNSNSPKGQYASYEVGQMVYLDSSGVFQILDASESDQVKKRFGVITSVNEPEEGDLGVRPWGKIVGDLDLGAFTVGDALYYDDTVGAPFLTATAPATDAIPMYIKISDTTGMYITDMVGGGGDQIYISQVPDGTPTPEDVGGIDQGTLPENIGDGTYTLSEVIDQLLWPSICPTAPSNVPSIAFTASPGDNSLFVIGETVDIDFTTGAANLGLWNTVDGSSQVYQGDIITSTLTGPNGLNQSLAVTNNNPENPSVTGHTIVAGSGAGNTWTLTTVFAAGTDPVDNYGVTCDSLAPSSTTKTSSIDFEGVYPVFQGTSVTYTPGAVSDTWDSSMDPSAGNASWSPIALFSFETLSSKEIYQGYGESDNAATWVNHRFAVPNYLGLSSIQVDGGQLGWQNATSTFNAISGLTLTINGQSVDYTIYERVNADAGGANNYRLVW
jgi:hypothetical protein